MIHVACAADENYLPHCAAMLASLLEHNNPEQITVHFLHGPSLEPESRHKLSRMIQSCGSQCNLIEIQDEEVAGLQKRADVAGVMWYRLFLPDRLPHLKRVLYLDADLLVLQSIQELWEMDLDDLYAAAVQNVFEPRFADRPQKLGLRNQYDYFNSGVLVLNLEKMRQLQVIDKTLIVARQRHDELIWQDQDPLNIVFDGNWRHIHPRWNCQNSLFFYKYGNVQFGKKIVEEACKHPAIVHFEGPGFVKPWHILCKHPYRGEYLRQRSRSAWPVVNLNGNTFRNRLLRHLPFRLLIALVRTMAYLRRLWSLRSQIVMSMDNRA